MHASSALTTTLTTESLLFAVFSFTLSFGASSLPSVVVTDVARRLSIAIAFVLTVLGVGAMTAWVEVFVSSGTHGFGAWAPAVAIAVGALAQPVLAWIFVRYITAD